MFLVLLVAMIIRMVRSRSRLSRKVEMIHLIEINSLDRLESRYQSVGSEKADQKALTSPREPRPNYDSDLDVCVDSSSFSDL